MIKLRKRSLAAIALTASAIILGTSMTANASTGADGFPILHASQGDTASVHKCSVIGSYGGYQAVVCADIITSEVSANNYSVYAQLEGYCQKGSGSTAVDVQCAQVDLSGQFADATGFVDGIGQFLCGHQYGACLTTRNEISTFNGTGQLHYIDDNANCGSSAVSDHDVWTVVEQGTGIELPVSDKWVYLESGSGANDGSNFSTGHYYVCA